MVAAKQNQKFPFHFLSAPPTPPAEENKKGKENFWFLLPRPKGADGARDIIWFGNRFGLCHIIAPIEIWTHKYYTIQYNTYCI